MLKFRLVYILKILKRTKKKKCLCVYTLYVLVWMYTSRNFKQCPADCQCFNIFLLPTFWRNFLSVADSIPLRETTSQAESLGGSLVRHEGLIKAAQQFGSLGEQSSCCGMQNRTPSCITSCSSCGEATQDHQEGEVLLAQQGDTVPQAGCPQLPGPASGSWGAGVTVTLLPCLWWG